MIRLPILRDSNIWSSKQWFKIVHDKPTNDKNIDVLLQIYFYPTSMQFVDEIWLTLNKEMTLVLFF